MTKPETSVAACLHREHKRPVQPCLWGCGWVQGAPGTLGPLPAVVPWGWPALGEDDSMASLSGRQGPSPLCFSGERALPPQTNSHQGGRELPDVAGG